MPSINRKQLNKTRNTILNGNRIPRPFARIPVYSKNKSSIHDRFVCNSLDLGTGVVTGCGQTVLNPPLLALGAAANVLVNFEEYSVQSSQLTYTPVVGTSTLGIVYLAYYDNPEIIYKVQTSVYSDAQKLALAKGSPTSVSGPVWQTFSLNGGTKRRRPKYTVDSSVFSGTVALGIATADLTTHGIFLWGIEGVDTPVSTKTYGKISVEYRVEGYGLQNGTLSGL